MKNKQPSKANSGIAALVVLTFIYGLTAVMARFFSENLGLFEQWYLRFAIAAIFMAVVFRKKIRFRKLLSASKKEQAIMASRGLIGFVLAAALYALSTHYATIGSVAVMQVVPTTAFFGYLLIGERINRTTGLLIGISFLGAVLVAMRQGLSFSFGIGELMSLVSGALFSLVYVMRKLQTGELNNYELAFGTTVYGATGDCIMSYFTAHRFLPSDIIFSNNLWLLLLGAGVLSVAMSLLSHYGFEHVKATTASIILDLELVFGIILGYLFYSELLTGQQFVGALLILIASGAIGYIEARRPIPGPV